MVITLPFSAAHAVVYTHAQTTADAVPALYGCLERLGGVPQRLVVDRGMRSTPIMTSWGYPFAWRFCSVMAMLGRKYRFRSAESAASWRGALFLLHLCICPVPSLPPGGRALTSLTQMIRRKIIHETERGAGGSRHSHGLRVRWTFPETPSNAPLGMVMAEHEDRAWRRVASVRRSGRRRSSRPSAAAARAGRRTGSGRRIRFWA